VRLPERGNGRDVALAIDSPLGWAWYCSGGKFQPYPHAIYLARRSVSAIDECMNLLIEEPPRHGKTEWVQYLVGWFMGVHPSRKVMYATHSQTLSDRFGSKVRGDIETYGGEVFGIQLNPSTRAKADWAIDGHGGEFFGVGIGGSPSGRGAHLLVTDDLVPNAMATRSKPKMEAVEEFLRSDLLHRREHPHMHIGIQMRWTQKDPHGILNRLYPGRYETVKLRAIAEADDPLGREVGEPLCPELAGLEDLLEIKQGMHPYRWSALYQQRPVPAEGKIWRSEWWRERTYVRDGELLRFYDGYTVPLSSCRRFLIVDLAASKKTSADYTVIGAFALTPERLARLVILNVDRRRMSGPEINPAVGAALGRWRAIDRRDGNCPGCDHDCAPEPV